eukprot:s3013_g1.t1
MLSIQVCSLARLLVSCSPECPATEIRENENDYVISASDLGRYYQDIQPSFTVALNIDQVKLCAAIPPLAATLQCVNHSGSKISQPDFDSYKTLFYPEEGGVSFKGFFSGSATVPLREEEYWRPRPGAVPPFDAPRIPSPTREEFNDLILDGKVFVIPGLSDDWALRHWDCDFFQNDPEFRKAAMNHQYTGGAGRDTKLGDDWQEDQTSSGAKNDTAPQVAPFYFGIKDVQFEKRPGWTKAMLKRVAKSFKVPSFMHPGTERDFGATP